MQYDIDIALKAKEHKIPVLYVRSKSDQVNISNCSYDSLLIFYELGNQK